MDTTTSIGREAENAALQYLVERGLKLVTRNFRCKTGEIDLVMRDGSTVCFVEVRFRSSPEHASGIESIGPSKIRKLIRTAEVYLQRHPPDHDTNYRFDIVSIDTQIDWIRGAFTAEGY